MELGQKVRTSHFSQSPDIDGGKVIVTIKSIIQILIILSLTISASGQEKPEAVSGRIDSAKPTIYFSFLEKAIATTTDGQKKDVIRLRLHNNSKWAILLKRRIPDFKDQVNEIFTFQLSGGGIVLGLTGGMNQPLCYEVGEYQTASCSMKAWLASGENIIFTVPRSLFTQGSGVSLSYNYEFEREINSEWTDGILPNEPAHRVSFQESQLPRIVRAK